MKHSNLTPAQRQHREDLAIFLSGAMAGLVFVVALMMIASM